ncbi:isoaspartyl peptidase/L-asparaginase isoform X3 [Tribolium madens]|uniref:isoaspartyl peptidase/L-asparaginase isoform X3 n=1 Tax=Tribolium madens TaxID=41895 RepID=UPI001CF73DC4|nr:isoaspartyl peptidase/L-asparaginase isoform X3 [Tribolium madens]
MFLVRSFILLLAAVVATCHVEPIVLVHGGADTVHPLRVEKRKEGVKNAAMGGYKILKKGGSVVDAVEEAVKIMEEDVKFNAGYGSALNSEGDIEMDACIMVGSNLTSGGVTVVKNVAHPVSLARLVMEKSPHFLLAGEGAKKFAKQHNVPFVPLASLMAEHSKQDFDEYQKNPRKDDLEMGGCGGVGAIAVDAHGRVAAASSTGGRLAKLPGRSSAAAIVGAGLYADDEVGAAVVTGTGESIARYVLAHEIINLMTRGFDAGVATRNAVKGITTRFRKPTGAITVSKNGQVGISFTTDKMAWAYQVRDDVHYGLDDYDHFSEKIKL